MVLHPQLHSKVISQQAYVFLKKEQQSHKPVVVNKRGLEFDGELNNYCLIDGSAEETEETVEICNHISSKDVSASLCLPLSLPSFTINNSLTTDTVEQKTHSYTIVLAVEINE